MAPCAIENLDHQAAGGLRKLRKPVIEKMRRDRINSSIEQLRILLEKEFQRHQLPSKPEKADILEMTVTILQRHMAEQNITASSQVQRERYSTSVQDSIAFLPVKNQEDSKNIKYMDGHVISYGLFSKESSPFTGNRSKSIWRPW